MKVYLDFDGVFVDSAFEAFRIMLASAGEIDSPADNDKDFLYKKFYNYRPYVGPAWNYKCVLKTILNNTDFVIPNQLTNEIKQFEINFFETRKKFKETNYNKWILLHKCYPFAEIFRNKLSTSKYKFIFLTNKNSDAVRDILRSMLPPLHNLDIISTTRYDSNMSKGDILSSLGTEEFIFIDDIIRICEDVQTKHPNSMVINANWGYSTNYDQRNTFVKVLSDKQVIQELFS